jgi:hypothetical protein
METACRVVGYGHYDERYPVGMLLKGALQLGRVYIALERHFELGLLGLVDGTVQGDGLSALDVALGGVEVRVAGHDVALVYEVREEHILGRPALVGGNHVLETGQPLDGFLQPEERVGPRVALVAGHYARPLAVAHGPGARVGEQVDVHLVGFQLKHIVMSLLNPLLALFSRALADRLHHLDFPRFSKG